MKSFLALILIVLLSSSAFAGPKDKDSQVQIDEMKRIIDTQGHNLANTVNQLQQLLSNFQAVSGQIDQALHDNADQAKIIQDLQKRLDVNENKLGLLTTQLEEIKAAGLLPPTAAKNYKEFRTFEQALTKYNAEEYKEAIDSLRQFMSVNPKSIYWEFAQYWVGESYFALRDYPAAVAEYQQVVKKYPNGAKASYAMLKQGLAFFELQSFDASKAFLEKVAIKYPGTNEATLARNTVRKINSILDQREKEKNEKKMIEKLPEDNTAPAGSISPTS